MRIDIYLGILILSVFVASVSQIFLKLSAKKTYSSIVKEYVNKNVIIGYGLLILSTILTIVAFSGTEYKNGPVIESLGYFFILILTRIIFKEPITKRKILGNLLILAGICIYYI